MYIRRPRSYAKGMPTTTVLQLERAFDCIREENNRMACRVWRYEILQVCLQFEKDTGSKVGTYSHRAAHNTSYA